MKPILKYKKLHPNAQPPQQSRDTDAGWDLFALFEETVNPGETVKVRTGIALELPSFTLNRSCADYTTVFFIKERSSVGAQGIAVRGGVCDKEYRGEYIVCVQNTGKHGYTIAEGQKIAQIVALWVPQFELQEVGELSESDRGTKGFGSSGI